MTYFFFRRKSLSFNNGHVDLTSVNIGEVNRIFFVPIDQNFIVDLLDLIKISSIRGQIKIRSAPHPNAFEGTEEEKNTVKYCDFTHYTLLYINVFKIDIIYTAPTCDGDLIFSKWRPNGDPILNEMGT